MAPRLFHFPWRSRRHIDADVECELDFHLQSRITDLVALGHSTADATARARAEFGDLEDARQYLVALDREIERSHRRRDHMQELWQDARYALRRMRAAPVFALTAVGTLALAIGANTAVFSVVDAALLRGLPYPNADRVVAAFAVAPFGRFVASPPDFTDWRAQTRSFTDMAAFDSYPRTMTGLGEPRSVPGARVTTGFFSILASRPRSAARLQLTRPHSGTRTSSSSRTHCGSRSSASAATSSASNWSSTASDSPSSV
jgi:putative ABC transport system permease protein